MRLLWMRSLLFPLLLSASGLAQVAPQFHGLENYQSQRSSSFDRAGGNHDYVTIKPGETVTIFDADGPGEIRHIWTTLPPWSEQFHLKRVVLRMYWDGEKEPSVETPIGDFFGLNLGTYFNYSSAYLAVITEQALNSYFVMPFQKHARITVTNQGEADITDYYWNIDWVSGVPMEKNPAYFHAQYRQCTPCRGWYKGKQVYQNTPPGASKDPRWKNVDGKDNYVFLDAKGDGEFLGLTLGVLLNRWGGWNEGDEMIWIDGESQPRIHGTGGEDYFNGAWGFIKTYSTPYVGLTYFDGWQQGSRYDLYRWHAEAPIRFHKSIRVTMEDGHANIRSDNFYSVAYWYQREPHAPFPPLPPPETRIPEIVSLP